MQNTKSLSLFPATRSYTTREKVTANNASAEIKATRRYCGERITFIESFWKSGTLAAKGAGNSDIWLDGCPGSARPSMPTLATGFYRELRLRVRLMCLPRTAAVTIQSVKPAQRPISAELGCHAAGAGVPDVSRIAELAK
jgi:hypothetical protein